MNGNALADPLVLYLCKTVLLTRNKKAAFLKNKKGCHVGLYEAGRCACFGLVVVASVDVIQNFDSA